MQFLSTFAILLAITGNKIAFGQDNIYWRIQDDLRDLNATCPPYDTCMKPRDRDSISLSACQCEAVCMQFGTCCADSSFNFAKPPKIRQTCRPVSGEKFYYMVDQCPETDDKDSVWQSMCQEEWNGEDDVLRIVPVTSLFTLITYKNYFCFRCHERTDDFLYWSLNLGSSDYEFDPTIDDSKVSVCYDQYYQTWVAPLGAGGQVIPINLTIDSPMDIWSVTVLCQSDMISHCSDTWNDKDTSEKCAAYMGIMYINKNSTILKYRNVHCALCNFEDLKDMSCRVGTSFAFGAKVPFSFTHLLDINRSDGDKVGKTEKCQGDFLWDPYARRCRELLCALPGYVVKNGKCTPP